MFNQLQITSLQVGNIQAKETTIEPYIIHFSSNQVTEKQKYLILYYFDFEMSTTKKRLIHKQCLKQRSSVDKIYLHLFPPNFISMRKYYFLDIYIFFTVVHHTKDPERNREMLCDNVAKYY